MGASAEKSTDRPAIPDLPFEGGKAVPNQVKPDVRGTRPRAFPCGSLGCQPHHGACHLRLRLSRAAGHHLDAVPVVVARTEIHVAVGAARVLAQHLLGEAHGFDKLAPVHDAQETQAVDAVSDGNLVGGLALAVGAVQLLHRESLFDQAVLHPTQHEGHIGSVALKVSGKLLHEGIAEGGLGSRQLGERLNDEVGLLLGDLPHAVRPRQGQVAVTAPPRDAHRHTTEVFDQRQTEHDRHGPEFAEIQRRNPLVGLHEHAEVLRIEATVHVGDQFQRQAVHAGMPVHRPSGQARKTPTVADRKMEPSHPNLLLNEMEVVHQPLSGGRHMPSLGDCEGDQVESLDEDSLIVRQARQEAVGAALAPGLVPAGQRLRVTAELGDVEELGAERFRFLFRRGNGLLGCA